MTYLAALAASQVISALLLISEVLHAASATPAWDTRRKISAFARCVTLFVASVLLVLPLVAEFLKATQYLRGDATPFGTYSFYAWATCAGGLLLTARIGIHIWARRHEAPSFRRVGLDVIALCIGVYMAGAAIDQLRFVGGGADVGAVAWSYFRDQGVSDMQCDRDVVLARRESAALIRFRCPTSIMLGQFTAAPFIPWPGYTEGESRQLAGALRKLESESASIPADAVTAVQRP